MSNEQPEALRIAVVLDDATANVDHLDGTVWVDIGPKVVQSAAAELRRQHALIAEFPEALNAAVQTAWREAAAEERERCAKICDDARDTWADGSDQWGNPCPARVRATPAMCAALIRGPNAKAEAQQ